MTDLEKQRAFERQRRLRGYIMKVLLADYPHHVPRFSLDEALFSLGHDYSDGEVLAEVVYLRDLELVEWDASERDGEDRYAYVLTPEGRRVAQGQKRHEDVVFIA